MEVAAELANKENVFRACSFVCACTLEDVHMSPQHYVSAFAIVGLSGFKKKLIGNFFCIWLHFMGLLS